MHASRHCNKLNYCLFFKLTYEENEFPFGEEDSPIALSILCKHCSKDFNTCKKRNNHKWTCKKNPKEEDNKDRKNRKRRKKKGKGDSGK